jgi:sec-independent protein translocase protein TatA
MIPQVGVTELLIILAIILLLFGAKRIPELARSLGKGTREFRRGVSEDPQKSKEVRSESTEGSKEIPREKEAHPQETSAQTGQQSS